MLSRTERARAFPTGLLRPRLISTILPGNTARAAPAQPRRENRARLSRTASGGHHRHASSSLLLAFHRAVRCSSIPALATVFATVHGVVHDPQHRPIAGAQVTLQAADSNFTLHCHNQRRWRIRTPSGSHRRLSAHRLRPRLRHRQLKRSPSPREPTLCCIFRSPSATTTQSVVVYGTIWFH